MTHPALLAIAAEECRKRSLRLGTTERPGAVPHFQPIISPEESRRRGEIVFAAIANGAEWTHEIEEAIGHSASWCATVLDKLVRDGRITKRKQPNGRFRYGVKG